MERKPTSPGLTRREKCKAFFIGMSRTFGITGEPIGTYQPHREDDDWSQIKEDLKRAFQDIDEAAKHVMNKQQEE